MKYIPNPIDTSDIMLSDEIIKLAQILAKNTHETWARNKMREGFVYGEVTDDVKRTHKCLVPFEQLSETEKAYDLDTALETVKLLIKLGFHVEGSKESND